MKISKPNRISHTYEQTIHGRMEEIMPMFCPVRELDWCESWEPKEVFSNSGVVEPDCIFKTPDELGDVLWIVSDYDPGKGYVRMYYHLPGLLVTKLEIQVKHSTDNKSKVNITYTKTAISDKGEKSLEDFTRENYNITMQSWEKAMNHYLETGEMLTGLPGF